MAYTIQHNAKESTKDFQNFSYFLGGIDDTHQNLDQFTPYIPGVARIWMYKVPHYMNVTFKDKTKHFKTFIEAGYTSVSGINDISVNFTDFNGGFANQSFSTVSSSSDGTNEISISMFELTGSPIREYLDTWVTGVRDPRSGIAHYHGAIAATGGAHVNYGEINHTCEFIFTDMDPTAQDLEYACMFAHGFPTSVPKGHLNYSSGDRGAVTMECSFRISKYESCKINEVAGWYLANSKVEYNYLNFDPGITINDVRTASLDYGESNTAG